jgi:hypothetical protein
MNLKPKKPMTKQEGIILITVLSFTTIMMIFVIGIVSTNVGQVNAGQKQIDRIKYEQLAFGLQLDVQDQFWRNTIGTKMSFFYNALDQKNYPISSVAEFTPTGLNGTYTITTTSASY